MEALKKGKTCIVSDIDFCKPESRDEIIRLISANQISNLKIESVYFKNDYKQCVENVIERYKKYPARNIKDELANITKYSVIYRPPTNGNILEVWRRAS